MSDGTVIVVVESSSGEPTVLIEERPDVSIVVEAPSEAPIGISASETETAIVVEGQAETPLSILSADEPIAVVMAEPAAVVLSVSGEGPVAIAVPTGAVGPEGPGGPEGPAGPEGPQGNPGSPAGITESRTIAVNGLIAVPVGASNFLPPFYEPVDAPPVVKKLIKVKYAIRAGSSVTFAVTQNGSNVSGLSALVATTTPSSTNATPPPTITDGDAFAVVVSAVSGTPDGLSVSIVFETTQ